MTRALPAHTASELTLRSQFSLSHLLATLGAALALGSLSFAVATAAGVWAGRRFACNEAMPAAVDPRFEAAKIPYVLALVPA